MFRKSKQPLWEKYAELIEDEEKLDQQIKENELVGKICSVIFWIILIIVMSFTSYLNEHNLHTPAMILALVFGCIPLPDRHKLSMLKAIRETRKSESNQL